MRFNGPVNPMGSCGARSVYLTTRFARNWQLPFFNQRMSRMTVEYISWSMLNAYISSEGPGQLMLNAYISNEGPGQLMLNAYTNSEGPGHLMLNAYISSEGPGQLMLNSYTNSEGPGQLMLNAYISSEGQGQLMLNAYISSEGPGQLMLNAYISTEGWCLMHIVCVEVLQPSQPNGVMWSPVSLPNHTFRQKLITALL